jgi:hypothetical protein
VTTIAIDGLNEEEFRRSIEGRLRRSQVDEAFERLRGLIAPYAGPGRILPERFLTVTAAELSLFGWDQLSESLRRHDRPGRPITALQIAFGWPGEDVPQPDAEGHLHPLIETSYYTDDAFPFSASARDDLLDGYSYYGCSWADDCQASDNVLSLTGIDDLHGALAQLEARLLKSEAPDEDEIRAGSIGACLLSVLLFQTVEERITRDGLPRPLCVMAGSNGVYPYFDAPVVGMPAEVCRAAGAEEEELGPEHAVPGPRYSSLLVTGIPRAQKRAVLVLEESEEEMGVRLAKLRGLAHGDEPDEPARREAAVEQKITAAPGGPLLVKKHGAKGPEAPSWDFRDMLSSRDQEPAHPSFDLGPGSSDDDWDDFVSDAPEPPTPALRPVETDDSAPPAEPPAIPENELFNRLREAFPPPPPVEDDLAEEPAYESQPEPEFEPADEPEFGLETPVELEPEPELETGPEPVASEASTPEPEAEPPLTTGPNYAPPADQADPITEAPDWWREERLAAGLGLPDAVGAGLEALPEAPFEPAVDPMPEPVSAPSWANGLAWRERTRPAQTPRSEPRVVAVEVPHSTGRKRQVGVSAEPRGLWQRLRAWFGP